MKVILNEFVPQLGEAGDTVDVSPGYARNYLVPQKLAFEATPANIKTYENNLKQRARKISKLIKDAEEQKAKLEAAGQLVFVRKAGEDGKLFGSVTSSDIVEALKEKGFEVDRRKIALDHPIKTVGEVEARIKIHSKVTAAIKIMTQAETGEEPSESGELEVKSKESPAEDKPAE